MRINGFKSYVKSRVKPNDVILKRVSVLFLFILFFFFLKEHGLASLFPLYHHSGISALQN